MSLVTGIFKRFFIERFHDQSAQIAYYFMLAILPFLLFAVSLLSFFPFQSNDFLSAIEPFAPKGSLQLIERNLDIIMNEKRPKLASFSLIASFWIASMAVQSIVRAMNDAYNVVRKENFFVSLVKDLIVTACLMIALIIPLLVPILEEISYLLLSDNLIQRASFLSLWTVFRWGLGTAILFLFFILFYKIVPSTKIKLRSAFPGALFSTISWQLVSIGFSYYVTFANYTLLYGQLGSMIVLLIWFYLTAAVLLIGGLINADLREN